MSRAVAVTAALAVFLLVGCRGAERSESGEIIKAGNLTVFSLRAGDCFNGVAEGELLSFEGIPCDQSHEAVAYLLVDHPAGTDAPYPGDDAILQFADDRCLGAFESYVGLSYERSEISVNYLYPTKYTWKARGDREVVCILYYEDGREFTGSLRGAER